ncbi:TonB-dependent receptor domain-containing protein [Metallibacterium scheffleri]|uniref:TonB-dependent receptor n=2 Tax=root TaxID=1 RepID=A0A4S3KTB1_9GAMM|nr:TonB-dependent receptor [Metallibacterium scheffleri]THD12246.1 TonB-dependent receptor [Metallibacterium scheffleri]
MKHKLLVAAIASALALPFAVAPALAQQTDQGQDTTQSAREKAKELDKVVVTGSLIPQAQIETASPVITITAGEMQRQGFSNVYDALRAQPLATGAVQDSQFSQGFTPGAKTISLLGLSPGFTLFLINGKPMADYPLLYNGQSNFVDLSTVPMAMVDHIDILPGNQSSIYGSSAIAGVVNIVLKQHVEGVTLDYRAGGTSDGGGGNQRLQLVGGYNTDKLNMVYGVQISDTQPIWGFQRPISSSTNGNPNPNARYSPRNYLVLRYGAHPPYVDPVSLAGANPCAPIANQFGGTMSYQYRPGSGYYCGSKESVGYATLQNPSTSYSGYLNADYRINDTTQVYGTLLYSFVKSKSYAGPNYTWWGANTGNYFLNANTSSFDLVQQTFAPEEMGGLDASAERLWSRAYSFTGGVRGTVGQSDWAYDAYYARSQYNLSSQQRRTLGAKVDAFFENQFLGPKLGTTSGYPIYAPDYSKFYQGVTPAQYQSFTGVVSTRSETYTQNVNLQVTNTNLFDLPAGPVGVAGVLQAGNSYWSLPADPALVAGDFWGITGSSGAGKRDNYAAALEFKVPIFSMLTADLSGRYDHYKNIGGGADSKATYKLGLEFRPIESLLFRGNYATAFRAPDLGYAFIGPSGFYSTTNDYYRCAVLEPGVPIENCTYAPSQYKGTQVGNANLKSITAKSYGFGVVWSPTSKLDFKADYYHINIDNEVSYQSVDQLMKDDAACLLGQLPAASPTCVAALAQVQRAPATGPLPYNLLGITVKPINVSKEMVSGIVASANYRWDAGRWGDFGLGAQYNVTLKHTYQQYAGDPDIDLLRNPYYSSEYKSIFSSNLSWNIGDWTTTLYGIRYGATPNYTAQLYTAGYATKGAGTVAPWILYNGSVEYRIGDNARVGFIVNNIRNSMPPRDSTWIGWPYYNVFNYNAFGRSYWLELNVRFGTGKK